MQRRKFTSHLLALVAVGASAQRPAQAFELSEGDAAAGVRTALQRGAASAISLLGHSGGFLDNPRVRIELPGFLNQAAKMLRMTGQQGRVDELVVAMNRAAESAVPEARSLLEGAVRNMSLTDARRILTGGDNSVTEFFVAHTRSPLTERFLPIVARATEKVSLAAKYDAVAGKAAALGLLHGDEVNVQHYVTGKALDGLYLMIGDEERKIRKDPVGTGSAILQKAFGSLR